MPSKDCLEQDCAGEHVGGQYVARRSSNAPFAGSELLLNREQPPTALRRRLLSSALISTSP
ncbi:hypothetical protein ACF3MZ_28650 [Paenibacillaceae bacterium WGS1546]|uniref:hypothetical protein n=1 Tax=Cohnella sp. WGS1546 TaxID=3366810 RepID=UPI00372D7EC7